MDLYKILQYNILKFSVNYKCTKLSLHLLNMVANYFVWELFILISHDLLVLNILSFFSDMTNKTGKKDHTVFIILLFDLSIIALHNLND
jgi:hypothetical protein